MERVLVVEKKMLVEPTTSPSGIIIMQVPGILEQGQAICSGGFYAKKKKMQFLMCYWALLETECLTLGKLSDYTSVH